MTKRYTVEFNAKVTPVKPLNDEFTLCKCYVMALDKNRNLSFIGKPKDSARINVRERCCHICTISFRSLQVATKRLFKSLDSF